MFTNSSSALQMDGQTDTWTDRQMDGRTGGQTERK